MLKKKFAFLYYVVECTVKIYKSNVTQISYFESNLPFEIFYLP